MTWAYNRFASHRRAALRSGSTVTGTRAGPVEYVQDGPQAAVAVLLFHGSPGGYDQRWLLDPLLDLGCRAIAWSRPGYLRTPLTTGAGFPAQADAAAALLDHLGVSKVIAYGISGGGPSALEFARRHPARTAALILESAITRRYDPKIPVLARTVFLSRYGTWAAATLSRLRLRAVLGDFVRQESTLDGRARGQAVDWIMAERERREITQRLILSLTPHEDRAPGLRNDLARFAVLDDSLTADVGCPALVLHGSHDGDVDAAHAHHAAATISGAVLHIVPGGWHVLRLSASHESALEATRDFLNAHGSSMH
ncbi:alpha/beta fold hydrolase [Nonomuraea sp. KM90]|uniref:alpha/beta fold hydrolase n=1 Tax=Nonomuraea sp. KM90 TaxID=3457428 RepID=UPI003FCDBFF4